VDYLFRSWVRKIATTDFWPAISCEIPDVIGSTRAGRKPILRRRENSEQIPAEQKKFFSKIFWQTLDFF
jgi:hypothetical protein